MSDPRLNDLHPRRYGGREDTKKATNARKGSIILQTEIKPVKKKNEK
jgi:hypothetical protein